MVRLPPDNRGDDKDGEGIPSLAALSQEVKELLRLISASDISELHLESGPVRITIKRGGVPAGSHTNNAYTPPHVPPESQAAGIVNLIGNSPMHGEEIALEEGEQLLVAPMVGTFYAAPSPGEPPYVSENDPVDLGQT